MNYKLLGKLFGFVLAIEAGLLLLPLLVSAVFGESVLPYVYTIAILLLVSVPLILIRPSEHKIYAKEGFVCVAGSWILLSLFGALPFVFDNAIPNYINALFETVSGFTTTGATILTDIESLNRGILFWRSFTHWIGGMGILVFMLAIVPSLGGNAIHIMRAEVPGPTKDKLVPKAKQTALILYGIYIFLTVAEAIALLISGLGFYDSAVTALSTAGTGGFSVKNASIAGYNNPAAEWIVAIFMLIFGINFNMYFFIIVKKLRPVLKNEEFRIYILLTALATVLITVNVWHNVGDQFSGISECIRTAFFQITSIMSTTGFVTTDYNALWPEFSKILIVFLTLLGACAGSTAGGLKMSRFIILLKTVGLNVKRVLKPHSINTLRLDGEALSDDTEKNVTTYFALYVMLIIGFTLLISVDGKDFTTTVTSVITCFNNVGPGLAEVGPVGNFAGFSYYSKIVLSIAMLFGRLEIIPMLIMLSPSTWRKSFRANSKKISTAK